MHIAGRKLFDWEDTVSEFEKALCDGAQVAIFTHTSNVFGYILPVDEMAALCRRYGVPFIVDAAQSAGVLPVRLGQLGADSPRFRASGLGSLEFRALWPCAQDIRR